MFDLALAVATSATGLIVGSSLSFWCNRRAGSKAIGGGGCAVDAEHVPSCGAHAPDETLRCDEKLGHWGWHSAGHSTWWRTTWGPRTQDDISVKTSKNVKASFTEPIKVDGLFDTASLERRLQRPQNKNRSEQLSLFESRPTTPRKPLRFSIGLFGTRYPIADDEPAADQVKACAGATRNQAENGNTQWQAHNAAGSKSESVHRRRYRTVPLGSNPSESQISAARFAEKWING